MSKLRNLGQAVGGGKGPWERRLLMWIGIVVVVSAAAVTGAYHFDQFTEGDVFCGKLCHPNRPEYITHEVSPHANVECGECHIGPGLWPKVEAKIFGTAELVSLVANSYERPIDLPVERARPAEEICEQCHSAQQPYAGRILEKSRYAQDEANSETVTRMLIRMDESGAHWHIDHPVWYLALDDEGQEIVQVEVQDESGGAVTYQAPDRPATSGELTKQEMECTDCHNRAAHQFRNPEELVDLALAAGIIDRGLPYVKRESMALLSGSYPTQEEGIEAMAGLSEVYRSEFPDAYAAKQSAVEEATGALQAIYHQTVFPEMNLTWDSYPDNVGHIDSPGCFRCHGSEMVNAQGEAVPANCTLCHSVPAATGPGVQADPGMFAGTAGLDKPASHYDSAFSWEHRFLASDACTQCHGTIEYGTDGSSFCANGICHGGDWPRAAEQADFQHPVDLPGAHGEALCYECHQGVREPAMEDCATCHQPDSEPHYGTECARCHTPEGWAVSAASWVSDVPQVPHRVEAAMDCLACHAPGSDQPAPAGHEGFSGSVCLNCHQGASTLDASVIPHTIEGIEDCLACHGEGKLAPVPSDHEGRGNDLCTLCHQAS